MNNMPYAHTRHHRRRSLWRRFWKRPWTTDEIILIGKLMPAVVFVGIHYSVPNLSDRLEKWGATFGVLKDTSQLYRVFTHVAVHASDEHLWKNLLSYLMATLTFPQNSDLMTFYGVFFGGALAGLFATDIEQKRDREDTAAQYAFGFSLAERLIKYVTKKWQHQVEFCGASAAIYSLLCYNAVRHRRLTSALSMLFSEVISSTISSEFFSGGRNDGFGVQLFRIGHWAHAGGIIFGLCAGFLDSSWTLY